ncbi:MAG: S8 family serine peptidase [Cytophagales bacterium]|nr:S8 family serine peptidase [Cytophaga sp.]
MQAILRSIIPVVFLIVSFQHSFAQEQKYWISFKDKDTIGYDSKNALSKQAITNRKLFQIPLYQFSDVPVRSLYIEKLSTLKVEVVATSKWLNAVTAYMTTKQLSEVKKLSFVSLVEPVNIYMVGTSTDVTVKPELVHPALKQMNAGAFRKAGIDGTGIRIGVIDAGFYKLNEDPATKYLMTENRILAQRDFIDRSRTDLIVTSATSADDHGKQVIRMIAGYDTIKKLQYGMATNASFYLARTENGNREYRGEEDMWIMAMEWMDSLGVRLISTSLGYAIKMDDPNDNYIQSEMDGKTARITKAAQIAVYQKGIFLTVSAGNEGDSNWRIISAPADAEGVLSVGATNSTIWDKIDYSSIGPEALPYLKPNVSCFSPNGTSFSCPALAGFVACLMNNDSSLNNVQLKNIIQKSAHLYPYGNNYIGYGIPQANRALTLSKDSTSNVNTNVVLVYCTRKKYSVKLEKTVNAELVLFHKKNETIVIRQETLTMKKGKLKVKRPKDAARTTVAESAFLTMEVIWK